MRRRTILASAVAGVSMALTPVVAMAEGHSEKYNLLAGKPFEGTKLNILSVVTPQFDGLMLRDEEFTELTGIELEWTFIPFGSLQEKINAEGIAANGTFDVVNYLDSWGPPNSHWLKPIDELMERDDISMDRYPAAFARSAQFEGKTLGFPLRAHPQLMFYRKDLISEPPATWEDVIRIGKELKESNPDVAPLALYYNNDGNRQNLFIWLNFLWASGADIFNDDGSAAWASPEGIQATKDYIEL
ncbi:MAG: extracellular solute-binding protein, partial [Pseudomonadota bacterium]